MRKLLKIKDVLSHVPVCKSQLYAMIAAGRFPRPLHLGGSGSYWVEDEVSEWLNAKIEENRAA